MFVFCGCQSICLEQLRFCLQCTFNKGEEGGKVIAAVVFVCYWCKGIKGHSARLLFQ